MDRNTQKATYQAYRNIAIKKTKGTNIKVSEIANVQMTEEGAFVEATIWVPKGAIDETSSST